MANSGRTRLKPISGTSSHRLNSLEAGTRTLYETLPESFFAHTV